MKEKNLRIIISGAFVIMIMLFVFWYDFHSNSIRIKNTNTIKSISTEKLYKIWDETNLTDIHYEAYRELDKRGYWDEERRKDEIEAEKILNNYLK